MKNISHVVLVFAFLLATEPVYSEVPLEDASFAEGITAIRDMHGLNYLGLTGDLITIFVAANEASKAAEILYQNKWRPDDDYQDRQNIPRGNDPLRGLTREDREKWDRIWENIKYLQNQVTRYSTTSEKEDISQAIKTQIFHLNRIIAGYRDIVEQVGFVGDPRQAGCVGILGSYDFGNWAGTLRLWQEGDDVKGSYGKTEKNSVTGKLMGNVLTGTYNNKEANRQGTFVLNFSLESDGSRIVTGTWTQTSPSESSGEWGEGKQLCP